MSAWIKIIAVDLQTAKTKSEKERRGSSGVTQSWQCCYWCQLRKDPRVQAWRSAACKSSFTSFLGLPVCCSFCKTYFSVSWLFSNGLNYCHFCIFIASDHTWAYVPMCIAETFFFLLLLSLLFMLLLLSLPAALVAAVVVVIYFQALHPNTFIYVYISSNMIQPTGSLGAPKWLKKDIIYIIYKLKSTSGRVSRYWLTFHFSVNCSFRAIKSILV